MEEGRNILVSFYTITPLHVGVGQAVGAVDLPVTKEKHTGIPFIPGTSIKGSLRDILEEKKILNEDEIEGFLGKELEESPEEITDKGHSIEKSKTGSLIFTEAKLLAYPFRSLNTPFIYGSCFLLLERFFRDLKVFGLEELTRNLNLDNVVKDKVYVSSQQLAKELLILEDYAFKEENIIFNKTIKNLTETISKLISSDGFSQDRFKENFVILPDREFCYLLKSVLPVQPRVKLTSAKTASKYISPEGGEEKGNLWYEEFVPPESLFMSFIMDRPIVDKEKKYSALQFYEKCREKLSLLQLGGNETVGYGWCVINYIRGLKDGQRK